ncbi:hypothetical protein U1Q18_035951 [Sarracenia purpurea var. burkii]
MVGVLEMFCGQVFGVEQSGNLHIRCRMSSGIVSPTTTQGSILSMLLSLVATPVLHVPLGWALVYKSGMGNTRAALEIGVSYWLNPILIGLYLRRSSEVRRRRSGVSSPKDVLTTPSLVSWEGVVSTGVKKAVPSLSGLISPLSVLVIEVFEESQSRSHRKTSHRVFGNAH